MAKAKTPLSTNDPALLEKFWRAFFDVAEDARFELHKQLSGLIPLATTAASGSTRLANVVNDQVAELAKATLETSDRAGRELLASTRDTAVRSALRATETARTLVGRQAEAA